MEIMAIVAIDCASIACFTYLAHRFDKWWVALFALLFFIFPV